MNKITVMLEALGFDKGSQQVKGFRQEMAQAEGATGKFKAGATSAFSSIKSMAGPAMLGAGAAAVAFGVKAVGAFTDTAKAAIDMGAATGLATEDASRWIAVGDDMGVTAEQLTAGIGKIAKSLDDTKWGKYGIQTRDAAGEARDANDVLIDTLDMLGKVTNETERARIGNDLFGKGYKSLAPIVGKTADEYRDMLGAVEKGQVITEAEAKKAERMRLAQDALADALNEVTLAAGEAVAGMAPLIEQASTLVSTMTKLSDIKFPGSDDKDLPRLNLMQGSISALVDTWDMYQAAVDRVRASQEATVNGGGGFGARTADVEELASATAEAAAESEAAARAYREGQLAFEENSKAARYAAEAADDLAYATDRARESQQEMAAATAANDAALQGLLGTLDRGDAAANLAESFDDAKQASDDFVEAWKSGSKEAKAKADESAQATRDLKRNVIEYADEVLHLPAERITELIAQIDNGELDKVEERLQWIARAREIALTINVGGSAPGASVYGPGGGKTKGFGDGGFTGRGSKTDIAGVVHKGEYVLPSEYVDQTTGLPKAGARGGATIIHTTTPASSSAAVAPAGQTAEEQAAEAKRAADEAAREAVEREDAIQAAMYETGEISLAAYRKYLEGRQASTEKYSSDWMEQWRLLQSLREEEAAQSKKLQDEELARQEEALKKREEAAKATLEAIRQAYEQAKAIQALQRAERDVADALDDIKDAEQELAEAEDDKDRRRAQDSVQRAIQRAGEEMFSGAGARAEANGAMAGTVEWARFVRREVEQAMRDYPQLAGVLGQLLVGVPQLASGGVVKARPGGTMIVAGEGGVDEAVVPLNGQNVGGGNMYVTVNMPVGSTPDDMMRTLAKFKRRNGPAALKQLAGAA